METLPKNVWKRLSELFPANPDAAAAAADLFREYEADGYLDRPAGELLQIELSVIADFFRRVVLMHSRESPILRRRDTRWMSEFDYTLVNIRGAGVGKQLGNFLSASLFITTLRTKAIILSPVTRGSSDNLENLESHAVLRNELANAQAQDAGIGPEVQLTAFCEAAHLLGFVIGFDLDYRVDPLAAVVLHKPELFFWTQGGNFIADETKQNELRDTVRERIALGRKAGAAMDRELVKSALALSSIAPKPSMDGSGRTALAFRKLGKGVPHEPREAAVNYWSRVFDLWRDRYGFDFLVLRGTRSEADKDEETPDLSLVRNAADAARKGGVRRNIGVIAEGHPAEVESFGHQGVDLVLANDAEHKADRHWFQSAFELDDILRRVNLGRKLRFSVPLELNPGEKESLSRQERALIKRFTARFSRDRSIPQTFAGNHGSP